MADTQFVTNGQTDERTDGAILICLPKFLRDKKNTVVKGWKTKKVNKYRGEQTGKAGPLF